MELIDLEMATKQQAQRWVVKMDGDGFCDKDQEQLRLWLRASPENRDAFRQARHLWQSLDRWVESSDQNFEELGKPLSTRVIEENPSLSPVSSVLQHVNGMRALAASLLLCLFIVGIWQILPQPEGHYATGKGGHLTQQLADGSSLTLNTDSQVEVSYTESERKVILRSGEAYFSVAHDPQRPFVVYAAGGKVRAVGTEFNVYKFGDSVAVTVTKGVVEVSQTATTQQPSKPAPSRKRVAVNQVLNYQAKLGVVTDRSKDDVEKQLAWRRNKLHFDNSSLEAFVEELNRYSANHIVIVDSDLKGIRIGGVFNAGDSEAALKSLKASFHVESMGITPYLTLLYRKESG